MLFGVHASPWLTPIKSAVSSNEYVVQGDRQAGPLTNSPLSGITLNSSMHNKHMAMANPTEAPKHTEWENLKHAYLLCPMMVIQLFSRSAYYILINILFCFFIDIVCFKNDPLSYCNSAYFPSVELIEDDLILP